MENIKDISFDANGNPTITLNDGTVTSYVVPPANAPQIVTLAPGQSVVVTGAAA
jgi:hypothetical protein